MPEFTWRYTSTKGDDVTDLVEAKDFGHALQKIAAKLPDPERDVHIVEIWRKADGKR
jgi:hypothetical protein